MGMYKLAANLNPAAQKAVQAVTRYGAPAAVLYALYKGGKKKRDKHAFRDSVIANAIPTAVGTAALGNVLGKGRGAATLGALGALYGAGLGAGSYLTARGVRGVLDDK